jgi:2,4-dienoyl-CoA reductase-like NADH-dependent reductase (Old Yellow Enzyme family)
VLEAGISLVAMGRELLMDPNWLQKVIDNKQEAIAVELDTENQDELNIPAPLWNLLLNRTGWMPLKNKNEKTI